MGLMRRALLGLACGVAVVAVMAGPASAAHNGNNRAELTGTGVTAVAIVNYSEGTGTFNANVTAEGLADGTYTFRVRSTASGAIQNICTFTVSGGSDDQGCSAQKLPLNGFNQAQIVDSNGVVVASGTFDRRGNCRDPEQGGSQCDAPGHNK